MEFGASFEKDVMYMGDVSGRDPDEYSRFIDRASAWLNRHHIVLGEGVVRYVEFSEGPPMYRLEAPIIFGPRNIIETIID
jgi:hypothetical protein